MRIQKEETQPSWCEHDSVIQTRRGPGLIVILQAGLAGGSHPTGTVRDG
jgi:hypothetical protein